MPYLVGDLIKEITAGGPVPSFPKSFKGPPKLENEQEASALDKKSKPAQESQTTKLQEGPQEDCVKKKWERYYELNEKGELKPNFNKMTFLQFEQYMEDTQTQGRHKVCAAQHALTHRKDFYGSTVFAFPTYTSFFGWYIASNAVVRTMYMYESSNVIKNKSRRSLRKEMYVRDIVKGEDCAPCECEKEGWAARVC